MAAESLDSAEISWSGVAGDRRWAFVRSGAERNGFVNVQGAAAAGWVKASLVDKR